ncbi:MAG: methyltransferase domain-containing protein [Candidatus Thermoplasmatota archaeon]|nr:methyltransferase domain-containing protein [Candidatus Thermoplasmatota archaeon]
MSGTENDWVDSEGQEARFEAIAKLFQDDQNPDVLDIGCGTGDMYRFLLRKGLKPQYRGVDTNADRVVKARSRGVNAVVADLWTTRGNWDYVVASGTFAYEQADPRDILAKMWDLCNEGFAVSMLSEARGDLAHYDKEAVLALAKSYDANLSWDDSYLPYDFTIIVRKDAVVPGGTIPGSITLTKARTTEARRAGNKVARQLGSLWDDAVSQIESLPVSRPDAADAPEVKAVAQEIVSNVSERLAEALQGEMVSQARNAEPTLTKQELPAGEVAELVAASPVWKSFEGLRLEVAKDIEQVILDAYTGKIPMDIEEIVKALRKVAQGADSRLDTIARTEMAAVHNTGRELAYRKRDPEEEYRHGWIGPDDLRTSDICKEIKARVPRGGLRLSELKALVKEVSMKFMGPRWRTRDWVGHPNERHMVLRIVR